MTARVMGTAALLSLFLFAPPLQASDDRGKAEVIEVNRTDDERKIAETIRVRFRAPGAREGSERSFSIKGIRSKSLRRNVTVGSLVSLRWEDEECDPGSSLDRTATAVSLIGVDGESERSAFDGTFHVGYGIDSFAASELRSYLNPDASGEVTGRWVGGFDFAYLLIGQPARHGLWLYGGTVHGVRSADVNCEENPNLSFCKDELASADSGKEILYLVRNSTSLEAFVGLRGEFLTIGRRYGHAANLYLKGQAGFLTVANGGDDVVDLYHGAFGLIAIQGKLQDSYLEFGFGQSDLFFQNANDRWKIEGLLSWKLGDGGVYPFARLTLDSDFGSGADSVQTYIGVDIDLDQIYRTAARR